MAILRSSKNFSNGDKSPTQRLADLERDIDYILKLGVISAVDYDNAKVKVTVGDNETPLIKWMAGRAKGVSIWNPPEIGEQVLLALPSSDFAQAIVIGGVYRDSEPAQSTNGDIHQIKYIDGTIVKYNKNSSDLDVTIAESSGSINLSIDSTNILMNNNSITLTAGGVTLTLNSSGLSCSGDVSDATGTMDNMRSIYNSHTHPGDSGGVTGATTSPMT